MRGLISIFIFCAAFFSVNSQVVNDTLNNPFSAPLQDIWTVPDGIYEIHVQCWGGGGSGGGATGQAAAGGGGSGGGFSSKTISVQPGDQLDYNIGVGGNQSSTDGNDGSDTWFINTETVLAKGGLGGSGQSLNFGTANGAPQVLNGSIGDIVYFGGKGGTGTYGQNGSEAGGGGGAAGSSEDGQNGIGRQGGSGGANGGGAGAWAGTVNCNCHGQTGEAPGGGGSGGQAPGVADKLGGPGGAGRIIVSYTRPGIGGFVYLDEDDNCESNDDFGVAGINVILMPLGIITHTDQNGFFVFSDIDAGVYNVIIDTTLNSTNYCSTSQNIVYTDELEFFECEPFGIQTTAICSNPNVSIGGGPLNRGFGDQLIYVHVSNSQLATGSLLNAYVDIELDPLLIFESSSIPNIELNNNTYRFELGDLLPGEIINFTVSVYVSLESTMGETVCARASLFPSELCFLDELPANPIVVDGNGGVLDGLPEPCTIPWDQSSLSVEGWCQGDSVYFSVLNTGDFGDGDMECFSPVWLTVDGVVTYTDSISIQGGQTFIYSFLATGETFILNAEQHPLHPGNSHPNAHVELCGDVNNWTPNIINQFPLDDSDPIVDLMCTPVSAPCDPNDKTGYPLGQGSFNFIQPNQQLQYVIRFQNIGTAPAVNVIIMDTLDENLNPFTIVSGVSSHPYAFELLGPRVLKWTFSEINLPDSTTNELESQGFVTFQVEQNPNLNIGTEIRNNADIYFDFELPITTNTTFHKIYEGFVSVLNIEDLTIEGKALSIYPNPSTNLIMIQSESALNNKFKIYDQQGREVMNGKLNGKNTEVSLGKLSRGTYTIQVEGDFKPAVIFKE